MEIVQNENLISPKFPSFGKCLAEVDRNNKKLKKVF